MNQCDLIQVEIYLIHIQFNYIELKYRILSANFIFL